MTPNELYTKPVVQDNLDHTAIVYRCLDCDRYSVDDEALYKQTRLVVKTHGWHDCHDGRRYAILASLWFDDKPFAIVQSGGREGDDHVAVFVTDLTTKRKADIFMRDEMCVVGREEPTVDPEGDIPDLCRFYNCDFAERWKEVTL